MLRQTCRVQTTKNGGNIQTQYPNANISVSQQEVGASGNSTISVGVSGSPVQNLSE